MDYTILVRHSQVKVSQGTAAEEWELSEIGRARCAHLASQIASWRPHVVVTSRLRKAVETGTLVAEALGLPLETAPGLEEQARKGEPFTTRADFEAKIVALFQDPERLVYGQETGAQARARFGRAVTAVRARFKGRNAAIVTHGTVMSLWLAQVTGIDGFTFWQQLGMPGFVVLSRPPYHIVAMQKRVDDG